MNKRVREKRPGVEAAAAAHHGMESEVRYRVVTQYSRTYHETFAEAREEYRVRRAGVLTTPERFENRIGDERT